MARTMKWEHHTDSYHENHRIERKARPAGRLVVIVRAEMDLDEPTPAEIAEWEEMESAAKEWQAIYEENLMECAVEADPYAFYEYEEF